MSTSSSTTRVRLELYASGLKIVAGIFNGTSDPFAIVTIIANNPNDPPTVLGKTETIENSLSPRWTKSFNIDYAIGATTRINVGVYDEIYKKSKSSGTMKEKHKLMGSAVFEIGEILGSRGNLKAKRLRTGGTLFARVVPCAASGATGSGSKLHLLVEGRDLKNVDGIFGKSDPFLEFSCSVKNSGGASWFVVHRTTPIMNDLNPKWELFSIDIDRLCGNNGDLHQPILVTLWDYNENGKHKTMGKFETSVMGLLTACSKSTNGEGAVFVTTQFNKPFGDIIVKKAYIQDANGCRVGEPAKSSMSSSFGDALTATTPLPPPIAAAETPAAVATETTTTTTDNVGIGLADALPPPIEPPKPRPRFVEYLTGGCELELCIAIDFTAGNGDPRKTDSLHYIHPDGQLNDYEKAISAVGTILARYDCDRTFPVWGFGAKFGGIVQHCFQVGDTPKTIGVGGVLASYRKVFQTGLIMSSPTVYAEVITMAAATARSRQDAAQSNGQQSYTVLLIITNGSRCGDNDNANIQQSKRALENASDAPLSVVIVGVGGNNNNNNFEELHFLDNFHMNNNDNNKARDICQFVEFNKYANDQAGLQRATLEEIPDQLVDYFYTCNNIEPLPPVQGSTVSLDIADADDEDIDLEYDITSNGDINLTTMTAQQAASASASNNNNRRYLYDDTAYGTYSRYDVASVQPIMAPTTTNNAGMSSFALPEQPPSVSSMSLHDSASNHSASNSTKQLFHVQVPPGSTPGMRLQVQHPTTGQQIIVIIPDGVQPGGKFAVNC